MEFGKVGAGSDSFRELCKRTVCPGERAFIFDNLPEEAEVSRVYREEPLEAVFRNPTLLR